MKKFFLLITLFVFTQSFSQELDYDVPKKEAFQPMFSLGAGYYNSLGDFRGADGNYLLGNMGINTGVRINLSQNIDVSLLFSTNAKLHEEKEGKEIDVNMNLIGFNLDYTFNNILSKTKISPYITTGAQWIHYYTTKTMIDNKEDSYPKESGISIPIGAGISLDVSERIRFDIGMNYHLSFVDFDYEGSPLKNDNFTVVNFTMHYDLFTPKPDEYNYYDESNYTNVNFKAMDVEDSDKDGVADINDNCAGTPKGVKVDEYGCPFDKDNDGVPNYLDKEPNTKEGAVVNEKGVQLTDEEFHSMYSEYEVASREYAKFYNESEIKRDNYKTTNEYLIAKANAFNKKYNDQNYQDLSVGKRYMVQIGRFKDDIPSYLINRFLSFEDLVSLPKLEDESFIYAVGSYEIVDDAERRKNKIEFQHGELEAKVIVIDNGLVYDYVYTYPEEEKEEKEENIIQDTLESTNTDSLNNIDSIAIDNESNINDPANSINSKEEQILYRIQIGAYQKELSYDIFEGIDVVQIRTNNMTRYYVGTFGEHEKALIKQEEMKARGFEDAFIVTFNDGERININTAIKTEKKQRQTKVDPEKTIKKQEENVPSKITLQEEDTIKLTIKFYVQIGIWGNLIDMETQRKLNNIGGAEQIKIKGNLYKYIAGNYDSLGQAEFRLSEVLNSGFKNAFIYAEKDGERINMQEAINLLNK